jgi:prepilin peptidase CpaA
MLPYLIAAVVVTGIAAWTDWRTGNIPNWLTLGTLGLAPVAHVVMSLARHAELNEALATGGYSLLGGVACGLMPLLLYSRGAMGGGDVKIFAAIGTLLRTMHGIEAEFYCIMMAALIAPAHLAYEGKLFKTLKNSALLIVNPFLPAEKKRLVEQEAMSWIRLGPAIFLGMVLTTALYWRT